MDEPSQLSSLTVSTADYAVMYCLGALRQWATSEVRNNPEKRPKDLPRHWGPDHFEAVFYFATPELEERFLSKANALLPQGSWKWTRMPGSAG